MRQWYGVGKLRILLTIEYDGTKYAGWQRQKNALSIQQVIEEAYFNAAGEKVTLSGAGRTDAGVHALAQYAHFDTNTTIPPEKISFALNLVLPPDIRIRESRRVADDFHARFNAIGKHYRYTIYNDSHAAAIGREYCAHIRPELDVEAMRAAAAYIRGTHDFACFQAAGSAVKDTVRTIQRLDITKVGSYIYIDVAGNGFLYNMVRIIAGTLIEVGKGRYSPVHVGEIIKSANRDNAGATAPAAGLTLVGVLYEINAFLK